MDTLTEVLEVLRQVAALKRYDANAGRTNAGRHYTLNTPAPLMARIDSLAVEAVGREYTLDLTDEKLRVCEERVRSSLTREYTPAMWAPKAKQQWLAGACVGDGKPWVTDPSSEWPLVTQVDLTPAVPSSPGT